MLNSIPLKSVEWYTILNIITEPRVEYLPVSGVNYPTWICSISVHLGLVFVQQVIFNVSHLVVNGDQFVHVDVRTHLNSTNK